MKTFEDLKITRQYLNALEELGFTTPTPIQHKVIPLAKSGNDIIGIAQTGTGKTAAFLLPILDKLKCAEGDSPRAIIMVPSRELVMQVVDHAKKMAKYTDFRIMGVFGGKGGLQNQREELAQGVDIVIGTPGRFMELYFERALVLKKVKIMVIDEADRMMDMGFINQIRSILEVVPVKRQNMLFSATFSDYVERLTHEFLEFPTRIEIAPQATPIDLVTQRVFRLPNIKSKIYLLEYLLKNEQIDKVMVFCRTKLNAETISKYFGRRMEGDVRVLHGNKGQNFRQNAMEAFRNEEIRMLVATDVISRGIDIPEVTHVINFDVPIIPEDYVHRIGRTGRAGKTGIAITFASNPEMYDIKKIEKLIGNHLVVEPTPEGIETEEFFEGEQQAIARELDFQKKKADPTYQGAFHEKKKKIERRLYGPKKLQSGTGKKTKKR
ncbi:MAG: ATP-dependent RNA helicase RhlE [Flavobacteriales bacterium]|jgi:ATP-dependent RNA helicase RhlE